MEKKVSAIFGAFGLILLLVFICAVQPAAARE